MIERLRCRFILATMGALVVVLAVIMGVVNWFNYHSMDQGADFLLDVLTETRGDFSSRSF